MISAFLKDSVERSGNLTNNTFFTGDHHPYFLDFNVKALFACFTPPPSRLHGSEIYNYFTIGKW